MLFLPLFLLEFTDFGNGNVLVKICIILIASKEVMNEGRCEQSLPSLHSMDERQNAKRTFDSNSINAKDRANG